MFLVKFAMFIWLECCTNVKQNYILNFVTLYDIWHIFTLLEYILDTNFYFTKKHDHLLPNNEIK